MSERQFEAKPARRINVPVWVGLFGPSGAGKTYSALRLATGIQRVTNGGIYVVDSEAGRSLSYCDGFRFHHIDFHSPFGSTDYLNAITYCFRHAHDNAGASGRSGPPTIIIDSASHEHEGEKGYLATHESEVQRLSRGDPSKAGAVNMLAWALPSRLRQKMINEALQMRTNVIWCFRAKEKTKPQRRQDGKTEVVELGWQPIGGPALLFEMTLNILLLPGANGVPTWTSDHQAEKAMMKLPEPFRDLLLASPRSLDEDIGEALAKWARGDGEQPRPAMPIAVARDNLALAAAKGMIALQETWRGLPKELKAELKQELDTKHKPVAEKMDEAFKQEAAQ